MKNIFKVLWNEKTKEILGLPRPYIVTDPKFYQQKGLPYISKKIPIPWQSKPNMTVRPIDLIIENEDLIYKNKICPYCGIKFKEQEFVIRWMAIDAMPTEIGPRVFSDSYPFHIDCMKQARIFCPFMKDTKDSEFEHGVYNELCKKAELYKNSVLSKNGGNMLVEEVKVIKSFITDEDAATIINYMDSQTNPDFWIINNLRQMIVNADAEEIKPILLKALEKIKEESGIKNLYITEYMLSRYNPGFFMNVHIDTEDGKEHFKVSAVAYLNNDFTGGDIVFPELKFKHSPEKGDLAIFPSDSSNTNHGVEMVKSGVRYAMPIWTTDNPEFELKFLKK
jgi:hypothetical protein